MRDRGNNKDRNSQCNSGTSLISDNYVEEVVIPLLYADRRLSAKARQRLRRAELVVTERPVIETVVSEAEAFFRTHRDRKPEIPPPAIERLTPDGPVYELTDEQHVGLGFFRARGHLTVYVVRSVPEAEEELPRSGEKGGSHKVALSAKREEQRD